MILSPSLLFGTRNVLNSKTISTRFCSGTKLFWKLPFRVERVVNSRLSAFQHTKNHQKPFTEFGDRVRQRCRSRSVTEHARLHVYLHRDYEDTREVWHVQSQTWIDIFDELYLQTPWTVFDDFWCVEKLKVGSFQHAQRGTAVCKTTLSLSENVWKSL